MIDVSYYLALINQYRKYIATPPLLNSLHFDPISRATSIKFNLEFIPHPIYGVTKFRIREKYNANDNLFFYRYCWEINRKPTSNISAWENEHNHGLETDPHHHHHVPFNRSMVRANYNV